ncbi:gamma-glutamyl-gamma-aminobutyrate hydrolase family protein, partial [Actinosynnema sp. NPDC023658]|uniref:gamma-glutamyl-gamma-aminobutyrate hydrolase family protein n=1 Tax=Actinosynnema sp. NPDC023658 TaxID=3155465 RepID=UPI0033C68489
IVGLATTVFCHHHQAVDVLGDGLRVVAGAPDGTVEAVELPGSRFVLGVQSHPEADTEDDRLFAALVGAGRDRAVKDRAVEDEAVEDRAVEDRAARDRGAE